MKSYVCTSIVVLLFVGLLPALPAHARQELSPSMLSIPVSIEIAGGTASGFFINNGSCLQLVTARHVLFNDPQRTLKASIAALLCYPTNPAPSQRIEMKLNLKLLQQQNYIRLDQTNDVAVVRLAKVQKKNRGAGEEVVYPKAMVEVSSGRDLPVVAIGTDQVKRMDDVFISNEVFIFGYPSSIGIKQMPQLDHQKPLLRKGIVAGKNEAKRTIILDCPSYYGNSGGPVAEVDPGSLGQKSFRIIGIVLQFVPFQETWVNATHKLSHWEISNSGYSVVAPIDCVLPLLFK